MLTPLGGKPIVKEFEADIEGMLELNNKVFTCDEEAMDFIMHNRNFGTMHDYDIVTGRITGY